ncbi:DEAD/DEAH box helicase [Denitratisoma sp. agr-D3]
MSDTDSAPQPVRFDQLGLAPALLQALEAVGYETPSPIQAACIPHLLAGHDLLGEAQTGTGKTAAFALPLMSQIDLSKRQPQALILAPTRELAIQVAEALQSYARFMPGFHVLPIYGGQSMVVQLRQLERGAHVIVGTPGRVMDHLERKSLVLDGLKTLVLDEADEMLRMGFIDDVEWILEHTPATRQTALFSATMPEVIRRVARNHLREPKEVKIKAATSTVTSIRQRYWLVSGSSKLDAMTRMLEVEEDFDAAIVFARTKTATVELAEKLEARGYAAAALNGDLQQAQRERVIDQLKNKQLDIVVATDVAARGIDVPRISHVINYDIPYDTEAYVHRIGRTGRAGRTGTAILFVAPREKRMLRVIEQATRQPIEAMQLPSPEAVADRRVAQFKQQVVDVLGEGEDLSFLEDVVQQIVREQGIEAVEVAAALAWLVQRERPLNPDAARRGPAAAVRSSGPAAAAMPSASAESTAAALAPVGPGADPNDPWAEARRLKQERKAAEKAAKAATTSAPAWREERPRPAPSRDAGFGKVRYRIAVGRNDGISPKDVVGAIANEAGIESRYIGQINLFNDFSTVELPDSLGNDVLGILKRIRVRGKPMDLQVDTGDAPARGSRDFGDRGDRGPRKPWDDRPPRRDFGDRGDRNDRGGYGDRDRGQRGYGDQQRQGGQGRGEGGFKRREFGDRNEGGYGARREGSDFPPRASRTPQTDRPRREGGGGYGGDKPAYGKKPFDKKPEGERSFKPFGDRPRKKF